MEIRRLKVGFIMLAQHGDIGAVTGTGMEASTVGTGVTKWLSWKLLRLAQSLQIFAETQNIMEHEQTREEGGSMKA
eukprot:scaffold221047_cov17-Tisochrysis_lutea.AAC.1